MAKTGFIQLTAVTGRAPHISKLPRILHLEEVREVQSIGPGGNLDGAFSLVRTLNKEDPWLAVVETPDEIARALAYATNPDMVVT